MCCNWRGGDSLHAPARARAGGGPRGHPGVRGGQDGRQVAGAGGPGVEGIEVGHMWSEKRGERAQRAEAE